MAPNHYPPEVQAAAKENPAYFDLYNRQVQALMAIGVPEAEARTDVLVVWDVTMKAFGPTLPPYTGSGQ